MTGGEYEDETELRRDQPPPPVRCHPQLAWTDEAGPHTQVIEARTTVGSAPSSKRKPARPRHRSGSP